MKIHTVNINELISPDYNPRTITEHELTKLKNSINEFGYIEPIIVNEVNNHIVGGNQRYLALKELGYDTVDVIYVHYEDINKEKSCNIALNKISGEWNEELLQEVLSEIELSNIDVGLTGFDEIELQDLNIGGNGNGEVIEDNYKPEEDIATDIKRGDLFRLGNHYLLCGDATDENDIAVLLSASGERESIDMIFTDPPYNISFNGRSGQFEVIENDNLTDGEFNKFINQVISIIKQINPKLYYIWCNWKFYSILQEKLPYKNCIVWAKNVFGLGKGYRHQHEFCLFNGTIDKQITDETDLWEIKKDSNYMHPTQKPVELCGRALNNSKNAMNILDLFGGSGSTLIACEQLNRNCYIMEIDPQYCQVIINRWEEYTDKKAEKIN